MKNAERHHLKDNELAQLTASATDIFQAQRSTILWTIGIVVALIAGIGGYVSYRNRAEGAAYAQLAAALSIEEARVGPPAAFGTQPTAGLSFVSVREKSQAALTKYKEIADQYPSSDAGLYARYRQATTYMALGEPKSAIDTYQQVISQGGDSVYARMSKLGLAEAQAQTGDYEAAITAFRDLSQQKDGPLPIDGLLLRLGRTQIEAGKASEAQQTLSRLVQEFPDSPFTADAKKELDELKKAS
jgi:TolA-binding protein